MFRKLTLFLLILILLANTIPGFSQSQDDLPVYIVQSGDTLGTIAQRFGVPVNDLIQANAIANPNAISAGMPLKIPGLTGISGTLITQPVPLGETFKSLSIRYHASQSILARLNRITSPQELYAGASLVLPQANDKGIAGARSELTAGQSLLEASVGLNLNPWSAQLIGQRTPNDPILPGEILYSKAVDPKVEISSISPLITKVQITPLPLVQGKTITIRVFTTQPLALNGKLVGKDLHFFQEKENQYVALQGVYALANPGLSPFQLNGASTSGSSFDFEEMLILKSGFYPNDPPLTVDPTTIDPAVTKPEESQVAQVIAPATPVKYWSKIFRVPVDQPVCYKSTFGNRRSYNGGPYDSFHGGTDYGICPNRNIYAPAEGVVVFSGPLTVRGNATIIDHGWGVYSGYWHQKEIKVKVGDHVKAGDLIGLIGDTGRVTGPHLHWEMIVNGIQVEPVDWLENVFP